MKLVIAFCLIVISSTIMGCQQSTNSQEIDNQEMKNPIKAKIAWKSGAPTSSSQLMVVKKKGGVINQIDYSRYGNLLAEITPTKFRLPLQAVELANSDSYMNPIPFHKFDDANQTWIIQYGDFTNQISSTPEGEIKAGSYTDFTLFFFSKPGEMGMSSTPSVKAEYCPEVILDLPDEYENYITSDEIGFTSSTNKQYYNRKIIDSGKSIYQFSLDMLFPKDESGTKFVQEVFTFTGDSYEIYYPGVDGVPDVYDILDYKKSPGMGVIGNTIYTVVPWKGITIHSSATSVVFEIYLDLNGLIELYDNNTPGTTNDDILVLSDRYWERFKFFTRQFREDGSELFD